jgi:hypothetical protein
MLPPPDVEQSNTGLRAAASRPHPNHPASALTTRIA